MDTDPGGDDAPPTTWTEFYHREDRETRERHQLGGGSRDLDDTQTEDYYR